MGQIRRTEILIETHETKVIRLRKIQALLCERCAEIVTALTPDQTADILDTTREEVFRLVENTRIHLVNSNRSLAIICGNSFGADNELVTQKELTTSR